MFLISDMNISFFTPKIENKSTNFTFKAKLPKVKITPQIEAKQSAVTEYVGKILPERFTFGETELKAKELLLKHDRLERNAILQKSLLKQYYSVQDKNDYKDLLKEKSNILSQIKRLAKKMHIDYITLDIYIREKMYYNFYAPKIYRANTIQDLEKIKETLVSNHSFKDMKTLLLELIEYRKSLILNPVK